MQWPPGGTYCGTVRELRQHSSCSSCTESVVDSHVTATAPRVGMQPVICAEVYHDDDGSARRSLARSARKRLGIAIATTVIRFELN
jgi:hypothetical protein